MLGAENFEPAGVVAVLVGEQDASEILGRDAEGENLGFELACADSGIDQQGRGFSTNEQGVSRTAGGEDGELEHGRARLAEGQLGGGDFQNLVGDAGLAGLVVFQREVFDQVLGVVGGAFHGDHPGAVFGSAGAELGLENQVMDVSGQDGLQHGIRRGLEFHATFDRRERFVIGFNADFVDAGEWQDREGGGSLRESVNEARVEERDFVDGVIEEFLDAEFRDLLALWKSRALLKRKVCDHLALQAGEELGSLAADADEKRFRGIVAGGLAEHIGVQRAAQSLVRGHQNDEFLASGPLFEEGVGSRVDGVAERNDHAVEKQGVVSSGEGGLLGLAHLRGRDHLHGLRDLGGVFDRLDASADVAEVRHFLQRVEGLELLEGGLEFLLDLFIELPFGGNFVEDGGLPGLHEFDEFALHGFDFIDGDGVEEALLHGPKDDCLGLDGNRVVLGLLEEFHDAGAAVERGLGFGVEVGAELSEGGEFAVLGEVAFDFTGDLLHGLDLGGGSHAGNRETDRDGGADALVEKIGFEVDLAVGDRDDIRRDVG